MQTGSPYSELAIRLVTACQAGIDSIPTFVQHETIYGVSLYTTCGFEGFTLAVATKQSLVQRQLKGSGRSPKLLEMLKDHPDLLAKTSSHETPQDYLEIVADEWGYIGVEPDSFESVNQWFDDQFNQQPIDDFKSHSVACLDACLEALREVRASQPFNANCFVDDVFLCIQFSDIGRNEPELLRIATELNSEAWNKKLQGVWGPE